LQARASFNSFRSFAALLAEGSHKSPVAAQSAESRPEPPTPPPLGPRDVDAPPASAGGAQIAALLSTFASEIVRLRARAAELAEHESESLLQMIASRVLMRELELAPVDVRALVARVHTEWEESHPLRFRVAPADLARLDGLGATLEPDPALQPGDLQVEFADGMLDLRLGTRLASVLEQLGVSV
jgi:flagellar biosynthesis/type III secretory pathway protein FliH